MPLSGCHVVCAFAGSATAQDRPTSALGRPVWSRTIAAGEATNKAAPAASGTLGDALFHARAVVDGYGIIDPNPDINNADQTRVVLPAGETVSVYTKKDDKLMFVVA